MKRTREKIVRIAIAAVVLLLAGGKVSAAEEYYTEEYRIEESQTDEETANYERFRNLEKTSVEMDFLRNENLQQKTKILLFVVLAVIVLLFVKIKRMIYKKEKEKEDRK